MLRQLIREHDLGMEVVVEGRESAGMLEAASILGADFGQGFALAHAVPPEDLPAWLSAARPTRWAASPRCALVRWPVPCAGRRAWALFDVPDARQRHVRAGGGVREWLQAADGVAADCARPIATCSTAPRRGHSIPLAPGRDRLFTLLVEHVLVEDSARGTTSPGWSADACLPHGVLMLRRADFR
ncbi:Diguanylate cyclase OS=Rhodanobacter lindaniclasticus OX=75310 GN=B1991_13185 PE=4 SV=1 [Rhodanobacter lindaniclasticus]